jgi:hypothetical protein
MVEVDNEEVIVTANLSGFAVDSSPIGVYTISW